MATKMDVEQLKKIIESLVSKKINYKEGDLIIFYCTIFRNASTLRT